MQLQRGAGLWEYTEADTGLIHVSKSHHVAFTIDGGPKLASIIVDGEFCDGT